MGFFGGFGGGTGSTFVPLEPPPVATSVPPSLLPPSPVAPPLPPSPVPGFLGPPGVPASGLPDDSSGTLFVVVVSLTSRPPTPALSGVTFPSDGGPLETRKRKNYKYKCDCSFSNENKYICILFKKKANIKICKSEVALGSRLSNVSRNKCLNY